MYFVVVGFWDIKSLANFARATTLKAAMACAKFCKITSVECGEAQDYINFGEIWIMLKFLAETGPRINGIYAKVQLMILILQLLIDFMDVMSDQKTSYMTL